MLQRKTLGHTDLVVTDWCLGTMTFGNQTAEDEAFAIMNMAYEAGINFFDTAELYPVNPVRAETIGLTEEIVGRWITARKPQDLVLATKVCADTQSQARNGEGYDGKILKKTVESSLKRLGLDCIDLYQLHYPMRGSYAFRGNWGFDASKQDKAANLAHFDDVLGSLGEMVQEGKLRAFGLSNETTWGMARWIDRAEAIGGPRPVTIQNEYSLMARAYDQDLAELGVNEDVTLLSYSILAVGILTGKYQNGAVPPNSRKDCGPTLGGRDVPRAYEVAQQYLDFAAAEGLDPVQMAIAWQMDRPFPILPILGASTQAQMAHILAGYGQRLTQAQKDGLDAINRAHPLPF